MARPHTSPDPIRPLHCKKILGTPKQFLVCSAWSGYVSIWNLRWLERDDCHLRCSPANRLCNNIALSAHASTLSWCRPNSESDTLLNLCNRRNLLLRLYLLPTSAPGCELDPRNALRHCAELFSVTPTYLIWLLSVQLPDRFAPYRQGSGTSTYIPTTCNPLTQTTK